jgi:hypothetical protein
MSHSHYSYDQQAGRDRFADDVNRIFERNGMAFEFKDAKSRGWRQPCFMKAWRKRRFTRVTHH